MLSLVLVWNRCVATLGEAFFGASLNGMHFFILGEMKMKIDPKPLPVEYIKKIDAAGRLVIPEELRRVLKIDGPMELKLTYTDKGILIYVE